MAPRPVASWWPGHYVWPGGRTKLVLLGGISTRTGEAERAFSGLVTFLSEQGGYSPGRDILEGTFAGLEVDGAWRPSVYVPADTRRPLIDMAEAVAGCLDFYRQALPTEMPGEAALAPSSRSPRRCTARAWARWSTGRGW